MHSMHSTHFLLHCIAQAFVQVAVAQIAVAQVCCCCIVQFAVIQFGVVQLAVNMASSCGNFNRQLAIFVAIPLNL